MSIPKRLAEKRDELANDDSCAFRNEMISAGIVEGFNAATRLILESEEIKGLVEAIETVIHAEHRNDIVVAYKYDEPITEQALQKWQEYVGEGE